MLQYVLDQFNNGSTRASKLLIAWAHEDGETLEYRFIAGGDDSNLSTLGILDMTREMVLYDD